jgi:DNA polymerase-1
MIKNNKENFLIIDANSLIHRAYHALPPLTTKKGQLVNAVYGFLLLLFKAIKEIKPKFIAACFDLPLPTFRHKRFKEYKAQRPKIPKELSDQIPLIKKILKAFNIIFFEKQGYEADDLIGTIIEKLKEKDKIQFIILSGDLDTFQLIDKKTRVFTPKKGLKETFLYGPEEIEEKYGLKPYQLIDFKALKGDPSDNIPGIPGIGEKTAIKLIKEFESLENLYKKIKEQKVKIKNSLRKKLLEYKNQAFFSKALIELKRDAFAKLSLEKCLWQDYDKKETIKTLKELDFYSLIKRIPKPKAFEKENLKIFK